MTLGGGEWSGWPLCIYATTIDDKTVVRTGGQWPYEWGAKTSQHEACQNARFIAADALTRLSHAHAAERKLADDAVHELKHARAVLRHEQYLDDPGREAVIARHAARRKE